MIGWVRRGRSLRPYQHTLWPSFADPKSHPAAAYTFNPVHDAAMMAEGWEALRLRRQSILDVRDKKDLQRWKARAPLAGERSC
jgi:hypothetical protein